MVEKAFSAQAFGSLLPATKAATPKVIIEKSRVEVSLVEQDTIENVSQPVKDI